jgi:hypothetical protein
MPKTTARITLLVVFVLLLLIPKEAFAQQRELLNPMGSKYTLVIDQLSGFRASAFQGEGLSYAGPIGIMHQSYTAHRYNNTGDDVVRTTTVWLAPSADIFLFDFPLSIGGLIEIASTSGSIDVQRNGTNITDTFDLPTTTSITFLPRVGYLFGINDRFGIWPRAGLGYASRQTTPAEPNATKETTGGFVMDFDVGFLWRPVEPVFFRLGPEAAFTLGANHSATTGGTTTSASASFFQLGILGGVGVMLSL